MTESLQSAGYYYNNGRRVPLVQTPGVYAVRYQPGARSTSPALSTRARRFLREDSQHQGFIPRYNLQIYQVGERIDRLSSNLSNDGAGADTVIAEEVRYLNQVEVVAYATPVYRQTPASDRPMFVTNQLLVQFKPHVTEADIQALNQQHQVRIVSPLPYAENAYLLEATNLAESAGIVAIANAYFESGQTIFAEPNFITQRSWKATATKERERTPAPPARPRTRPTPARRRTTTPAPAAAEERVSLSNRQWHLVTARVTDAWALTRGRAEINIAILDDGVEVSHPEFSGRVVDQFDFDGQIADGTPKTQGDNHGTACASVAVAGGITAFGAAPDCSLIAVRTPLWLATADEAEMFRWTADRGADVISCSWGPADGGGPFPLPDATRAAIHYCVTTGRDGRGIPIFFAAGNGNESVSEDGYAANPDVMAVAASTSEESRAPYSDFGPEIWLCAPSNGGSKAIFTADRQDDDGYNPARGGPSDQPGYFEAFGGTSSATPLVAGIAGLMLAVNPELTVHQVRTILQESADRIGSTSSYNAQGHSRWHGYGRVNALRAVERARDLGDQGNGSVGAGAPSIRSQSASLARTGGPPRFDVDRGGRRVYAVEVAARAELFDSANHGSERNENNFYGSWQDTALLSSPTYTLPAAVWNRLKNGNQLYYRAHVADDNAWSNYAVTVSDNQASQAPAIQITGQETPSDSGAPSIRSQSASLARTGSPPRFDVDRGGRRLYAVEVATRAELFDNANHGSERAQNNFYGSWQDTALLSSPTYTLPAAVWNRLKNGNQLYYRAHVADDNAWANYAVTVSDSQARQAPAIQITGEGSTGPTPRERITYPSGATFDVVTAPQDDVDYSDPVAAGVIPLIDTQGRLDENLAPNFKLRELAPTDGARYARIAPELVEALQRLRARVGASIIVNSAYRHPALNAAVDGAGQSQHMTGRAADIRTSAVTPLELARLALAEIGCDIGIGLGRNSIHLDLRGAGASWVYEGAVMNEAEFDRWVRDQCAERMTERMTERQARREVSQRVAPAVMGPETYDANAEPPIFRVEPGLNRFFAVEVATDWHLFDRSQHEADRSGDTFYGSWQAGLQEAGGPPIFQLPTAAWERLRTAKRLYYRILTASANSTDWPNYQTSLPDDLAGEAPWIDLVGSVGDRLSLIPMLPIRTPEQVNQEDTFRWLRNGHQ